MKVVVFCPNMIGDTVMATPAFRALRRGLAGATILGVIRPQAAATLEGAPWFDELIRFDHKARDRKVRSWAVLGRLRDERADVAVLFPNSWRTVLLAVLAGIPRRIGYDRSGRGFLLTDRLTYPTGRDRRRVPTPIVESYLALSRSLGCTSDSLRPELFTTAADEAAADRAWTRLGLGRDEPIVCLNTGGAYGPSKNWPVEHFAALARRIATEAGQAVLVVCGPSERAATQAIVAASAHPRVVGLDGFEPSLGLTKACVRRSALLITTDSGPRHFATAFGVPVLTLFGPTHIAWTRTYHPHALHVHHPVPCGPCQKPACPLGHHRCMRDLTPEAVYAAARRYIGVAAARTG
jgi:heptosyltransferase-2